MFREKATSRRDFKSGLSAEEVRNKRADNAVSLRKQERDEQLARRRKDNSAGDAPETISTEALIADVANLPQYVYQLNSPDPEVVFSSAKRIRQLLSLEKRPPIDDTIHLGGVPLLVQLLTSPNRKIAFEAAWALTNIASGTSDHTRYVVECNAIPLFVQLLDTDDDDLRDQAVWALGNISGECSAYRDIVLKYDAMNKLLVLAHRRLKLSMLRNIAWTLSNFCRGKEPQPDFNVVSCALPTLFNMIKFEDEDVMADACWALSYLSDDVGDSNLPENHKIEVVIESGVIPRLVQLLGYPNHHVMTPALRTIGNLVTGNNLQTQMVLNQNVLPTLALLLNNSKQSLRKEACWTISNITAGSPQQVRAVIKSDIFQSLLSLIRGSSLSIKKEIAWAVSNALNNLDVETTQYLVHIGVIPSLVELLKEQDPDLQSVVIDTLGYILVMSTKDSTGTIDYVKLVEESGAVKVMAQLQNNCSNELFETIRKICTTYFKHLLDDDTNEQPNITEQGTFDFNPNNDHFDF